MTPFSFDQLPNFRPSSPWWNTLLHPVRSVQGWLTQQKQIARTAIEGSSRLWISLLQPNVSTNWQTPQVARPLVEGFEKIFGELFKGQGALGEAAGELNRLTGGKLDILQKLAGSNSNGYDWSNSQSWFTNSTSVEEWRAPHSDDELYFGKRN
jgi:hypothetical protein